MCERDRGWWRRWVWRRRSEESPLFIRNIRPFFTCNQPTKKPTYFNQEKKSGKCTHTDKGAITESDDLWSQGGGGCTLIFSHIRRLGLFFWVQNSWFQYFLEFSEKWIFFGGMKILWIFFGGDHKIGLVWGSFLCNLGSFFKVKVQNWDIFGLLKFQIFF